MLYEICISHALCVTVAWKRSAKSDHEDEGDGRENLDYRRDRSAEGPPGGSPSKDLGSSVMLS